MKKFFKRFRYSVWSIGNEKPFIEIKPKVSDWNKDFFGNSEFIFNKSLEKDEHNNIIVKEKISNFNEVIPYIFKFIPNLEALKADDLNKNVIEIVCIYLKSYE